MIRIDEIYSHTFGSYITNSIPLTRTYFCHPFGHTQPENLCSVGNDEWYNNYIVFHDQEPILLEIHKPLFDKVVERSSDLQHLAGAKHRALVTSELDSTAVLDVCERYSWKPYYYFFHGWAALDWYRGYDRTFLMPDPAQRDIVHSFLSPNRIIGGDREHRVLLMYHLLKHDAIQHAKISFPKTCPVEQIDISEIAVNHRDRYPDIVDVFSLAKLPINFDNETGHPMHSCWLSLFDEVSTSMVYLVTETVFTGQRLHLTEKIFKPICQQIPFVLASTAHSLAYLKSYGFKTFGDFWDESYDEETDDYRRVEKISALLKQFDQMSVSERKSLYDATIPILRHNHEHFYQGGFEKILWQELVDMMSSIKQEFALW